MRHPERGDIVMGSFGDIHGHEQAGYRPALVISPGTYNMKTGFAMMCAITSRVKSTAFEVPLPLSGKIKGVVLANHLRSFDWLSRELEIVDHAPDEVIAEVQDILRVLLF